MDRESGCWMAKMEAMRNIFLRIGQDGDYEEYLPLNWSRKPRFVDRSDPPPPSPRHTMMMVVILNYICDLLVYKGLIWSLYSIAQVNFSTCS